MRSYVNPRSPVAVQVSVTPAAVDAGYDYGVLHVACQRVSINRWHHHRIAAAVARGDFMFLSEEKQDAMIGYARGSVAFALSDRDATSRRMIRRRR